jgi:hypothetical protein
MYFLLQIRSHLKHELSAIGIYYRYRHLRNIPRFDIKKGVLSIAYSHNYLVLTTQVSLRRGVFPKSVIEGEMSFNMIRYSMPTS